MSINYCIRLHRLDPPVHWCCQNSGFYQTAVRRTTVMTIAITELSNFKSHIDLIEQYNICKFKFKPNKRKR